MAETRQAFKERIGVGRPSNVARTVGGPGTARRTPVLRDDSPVIAGFHTDHWDGRRDATVTNPITTYVAPIQRKEPTHG